MNESEWKIARLMRKYVLQRNLLQDARISDLERKINHIKKKHEEEVD